MQVLVIDPFHGAAGDMILGALLDLGVLHDPVRQAMSSVVACPEIIPVQRRGIRALAIQTHAGPAHRSLSEVISIVRRSDTNDTAIQMAERIFKRIAIAEEQVHGHQSHFHEVGADDAIADIIGVCTAFTLLAPDCVEILPVAVGGGEVQMAHGIYPVPAPATLAILNHSELSIRLGTDTDGELCTPTGAAILAEFRSLSPQIPHQKGLIIATGYGAGKRDTVDRPNVLRAILLDTRSESSGIPADSEEEGVVEILETNVDDVSGEVIGFTIARLIKEGARDACAIPCTMKKGRPGHLIRVISRPSDSTRLAGIMADELGTLGIRCIPAIHRFVAEREIRTVFIADRDTGSLTPFPVKAGFIGERLYLCKAEYEDARAYAEKTKIPLRIVIRMIEEKTLIFRDEEETKTP